MKKPAKKNGKRVATKKPVVKAAKAKKPPEKRVSPRRRATPKHPAEAPPNAAPTEQAVEHAKAVLEKRIDTLTEEIEQAKMTLEQHINADLTVQGARADGSTNYFALASRPANSVVDLKQLLTELTLPDDVVGVRLGIVYTLQLDTPNTGSNLFVAEPVWGPWSYLPSATRYSLEQFEVAFPASPQVLEHCKNVCAEGVVLTRCNTFVPLFAGDGLL